MAGIIDPHPSGLGNPDVTPRYSRRVAQRRRLASHSTQACGGPMTKCLIALCLAQSLVLFTPRHAAGDPVTAWNATAGRSALAACIAPLQDPLHEVRLYAMMHVAV